jgi:hypothetical protein
MHSFLWICYTYHFSHLIDHNVIISPHIGSQVAIATKMLWNNHRISMAHVSSDQLYLVSVLGSAEHSAPCTSWIWICSMCLSSSTISKPPRACAPYGNDPHRNTGTCRHVICLHRSHVDKVDFGKAWWSHLQLHLPTQGQSSKMDWVLQLHRHIYSQCPLANASHIAKPNIHEAKNIYSCEGTWKGKGKRSYKQ